MTNPMDVIKIRNQQFGKVNPEYARFRGTFSKILAEEGVFGFLKGVKPSVVREATYSSIRMGMYEPIKDVLGVYLDKNGKKSCEPTARMIATVF